MMGKCRIFLCYMYMYMYTYITIENVDIKFSAHDAFLE